MEFTIDSLAPADRKSQAIQVLPADNRAPVRNYQPTAEEFAADNAALAAKGGPASFTIDTLASTPEEIDKRSGAPLTVRRDVGGAPEADRLATLRKVYPDAEAFGDGNFVYTDPKTKRLTLYNPPGFDMGDVASVSPQIAEFAGGTLGGAMAAPAAIAAAPFTGGASLLTIPAAIGLGAAGGREAENLIATNLGNRVDTRGGVERVADAGVAAGVNALGARVGDLAVQGAKAVLGPIAAAVRDRLGGTVKALGDFLGAGVTPSAGAVTGNRALQQVEKGLANVPTSAGIMQRQAQQQVAEMAAEADAIAQRFGAVQTKQGAADAMRAAARSAGVRFADRRAALDAGIETAMGSATPVQVSSSATLLGKLLNEKAAAPLSRQGDLGTAISKLQNLVDDAVANGGRIPFGALRKIRTSLGQDLDRPDLTGYTPGSAAALQRVYGALKEDIQAAAASGGPGARRAVQAHDRYVRFNRAPRTDGTPAPLEQLQALADRDGPGAAFNWLLEGSKSGGTRLAQIRRALPPDQWDTMAATTLSLMGRAKPGVQGASPLGQEATDFSVATFLTNLNTLSPEAQKALFVGTRYAELREPLDRLMRVAGMVKNADQMANPSGTARARNIGGAIGAIVTALGTGQVQTAGGLAVSGVVIPQVAARLITSPRFVRWLAGAVDSSVRDPRTIGASMARLVGIAVAEPRLRDDIHAYLTAVRDAPLPTRPDGQPYTPLAERAR